MYLHRHSCMYKPRVNVIDKPTWREVRNFKTDPIIVENNTRLIKFLFHNKSTKVFINGNVNGNMSHAPN